MAGRHLHALLSTLMKKPIKLLAGSALKPLRVKTAWTRRRAALINIHSGAACSISNSRLRHGRIQQRAAHLMFNKEADEWPRRPRLSAASAFRSINIDKAARFSSLAVRRRSELSSSRPGARPAPGSICWDVRESVITLSHRCVVERPPNGGECVPRRRAGPARIVIPTSLGGFHLHLQRQGGLFCRQEF